MFQNSSHFRNSRLARVRKKKVGRLGKVGQVPIFIGFCEGLNLANFTITLCEQSPDPAQTADRRSPLIFFPSLTSLPYVQISSVISLKTCHHKIWCQSSIKFDRLRPFPVIHRFYAIISPFFGGVRVRSSSTQFDRLRKPSFLPGEPRCVSPRTLPEFSTTFSDPLSTSRHHTLQAKSDPHGSARTSAGLRGRSVINSIQDVKDQLSSSGFGFENPGEPGMLIPGFLFPYFVRTHSSSKRIV